MSIQTLKVVGAGIVGASGSSAAVYGTYHLVTKNTDKSQESESTSSLPVAPKDNNSVTNEGTEPERTQSPSTSNEFEELKKLMQGNCVIKTIQVEKEGDPATTTEKISLETYSESNSEIIKAFLNWFKGSGNKAKLGCTDSDTKNDLVIKTKDKKEFNI